MSEKGVQTRDSAGRFVAGTVGNPGGRPATPPAVKEMLKSATPAAVELLIETMNDEKAKVELRIRCAETIIDRVLGKAVQPLEAVFTTPEVDLSDFTIDELRRLAAYGEPEEQDGGAGGEN